MKKLFFLLFLSNSCFFSFSQPKVDSLFNVAKSHFEEGAFIKAGEACEQAGQLINMVYGKREAYFFAIMGYSMGEDLDNAFKCLNTLISEYGYNDKIQLKSSQELINMKQDRRWKESIEKITSPFTDSPEDAKFIYKDVVNFWQAYDLVSNDTSKAVQVYNEHYFDKGTIGLQSYLYTKIKTVENFVFIHNQKQKYYASIKANTMKAVDMEPRFRAAFSKLESLYPEAVFPPVYFVIGKLNSAGTVSSEGLLLALDQACMSEEVDTSELNDWEKTVISTVERLPNTVAHELIHFQQTEMITSTESDTSLLRGAVIEGMADFIGELISGKTPGDNYYEYAKGREKEIWARFTEDMYLNKSHEWIANATNTPEGIPADLGYWAGYQICKSYYAQFEDKKQAIYDMFHITDFRDFFEKSNAAKLFTD